ncbi:tetratricopeptide repeat protein [Lutibaculum baratangense]|uniref:TPR domain protein n=1 Tax=Lutibaculum baratangense AMV1 TaxID=631454 RepID=V4RHF5_9HYPH|nr:tetratricopeptide repeat protein [Lutibaculum baratangense]ESR24784.1 TPR domain protein [Lutibaculum baratangense AMV1]
MPKIASVLTGRFAVVAAVASAMLLGPAMIAGSVPLHAEGKADFQFGPKAFSTLGPESGSFSGSYLAGRLAGSQGDAPAAAEFYRSALAADPNNLALLDRAFTLSVVAGDVEAAADLAARVAEQDESHLLARLTLAAEAVKRDRLDTAADLAEKPGQGPLAELTIRILQAWIQYGQGQVDEALATIEGLQGPDWYKVFKPHHRGLIAELAGRDDLADAAFAEAYASDPGALRVVQAQVRRLMLAGRSDEARAIADEFVERVPNHPLTIELRRLLESGEVPEPLVTSVAGGLAELLYGLGSALGSDSAEEYAASYVQLALYLEPGNALARFTLADFYERLKDYNAAAAAYEGVGEKSPLYDTAQVHRALVLNAAEKPEEAQQVLEAVVARNPEALDAVVALGNIQRAREMFDEARETYTRAIDETEARGEENWTLYYFRGIANERTKRWDEAETDLKRALELQPGHPLVLNYLGYSWIDQGINLQEGLEMITEAVEARPNDGYIVDSLGWAYYRLGEYDEAVEHLERAVELMPQEAVINDHLGDAYWRIGRRLEAKFQWSHALDLDMSDEPGLEEKIRKKLVEGLTDEEESPAAVARDTE